LRKLGDAIASFGLPARDVLKKPKQKLGGTSEGKMPMD